MRQIYDAQAKGATGAPLSALFDFVLPMMGLLVLALLLFQGSKPWWLDLIGFAASYAMTVYALSLVGQLWLKWLPMPAWYRGQPVTTRGPGTEGTIFFCFGFYAWIVVARLRCLQSRRPPKDGKRGFEIRVS
jgi:hypothetical protein